MSRRGYPSEHPYWTSNAVREPMKNHWRDSGCPVLGHAIAKARLAADLKQGQVAVRLGVARSRIAQWEGAKRPVPWSVIGDLTNLLGTGGEWNLEPYCIYKKRGRFARMRKPAIAPKVTESPATP